MIAHSAVQSRSQTLFTNTILLNDTHTHNKSHFLNKNSYFAVIASDVANVSNAKGRPIHQTCIIKSLIYESNNVT